MQYNFYNAGCGSLIIAAEYVSMYNTYYSNGEIVW